MSVRCLHRERRLDEVPFERRVKPRVVRRDDGSAAATTAATAAAGASAGARRTALLVAQVELDRASLEILPLEALVGRVLIREARVEPVPPHRDGPLGKDGTEARRRPPEGPERFVERVGEAARRRAQRKRRELHQHQRVEAADYADGRVFELLGVDRAEVRDVREPGGDRPGKRDFAKNQIGQQLRQVWRRVLRRGGRRHGDQHQEQRGNGIATSNGHQSVSPHPLCITREGQPLPLFRP